MSLAFVNSRLRTIRQAMGVVFTICIRTLGPCRSGNVTASSINFDFRYSNRQDVRSCHSHIRSRSSTATGSKSVALSPQVEFGQNLRPRRFSAALLRRLSMTSGMGSYDSKGGFKYCPRGLNSSSLYSIIGQAISAIPKLLIPALRVCHLCRGPRRRTLRGCYLHT